MGSLPLNRRYTLVKAYYTGGLEDGSSVCCNCGRVITNIAEIQDDQGAKFDVGMDCMETLTSVLKNPMFFDQKMADFKEAKRIHNKVRSVAKKNPGENLTLFILKSGRVVFKCGYSFEFPELHFVQSYLPQYCQLIVNPELIDLDFDRLNMASVGVYKIIHTALRNQFIKEWLPEYNPKNFTVAANLHLGVVSNATPVAGLDVLHYSFETFVNEETNEKTMKLGLYIDGYPIQTKYSTRSITQLETFVEDCVFNYLTDNVKVWFTKK